MRATLATAAFILVSSTALGTLAQRADARVSMGAVPSRVSVGDVFTLEVRADAVGERISNVELPDLDGFEVVARHVTQPMHFQFGRGRPDVRATVIHQLRLRALRPGRFELSPARARVGRGDFESNTVEIEVTGSGSFDSTSPKVPTGDPIPPPIGQASQGIEGAVFDSDVFLRTVVDKSEPYVGEQVTVTVYLYTTVGGQPQLSREPTTDGFWVHDLLGPVRTTRPERQVVHGIPFRVYVLRRMAAFPLRGGELTIGAPELRLEQNPVFGVVRGPAVLERRGVPVRVNARPLPEPAPPGTVVGKYTLSAEVDRSEAEVGDAITLTVRARGEGNLNDVRPRPPELPGVRILEPEIHDDLTDDADQVGGERTLRFLLIAEAPGAVTIPSLALSYFNPSDETFGSATTDPIALTITGEAPMAGSTPRDVDASNSVAADTRDAHRGFGPIRSRASLTRSRKAVSAEPWFRWALAAPPLLWTIVLLGGGLLKSARRRKSRDGRGKQLRAARKRLKAANTPKQGGDARTFYSEVASALALALERQLGASIGGLTRAELRRQLVANGMTEELADRIVEELEACDFARFSAAGASDAEMDRCRQRVETLIDRLESITPTPSGEARS